MSEGKAHLRLRSWMAVAVLIGILLVPAPAAPQRDDFLPAWVQKDWEHATQDSGTWIAENPHKDENTPYDAFGLEWKWGLGKKTLRGRMFVIRDGKEIGTLWEYLSYYHPQEKRVVLNQFGSDGTYSTGSMKEIGEGKTEYVQRFFRPDGGTMQVGSRAERRAGEVHMQTFTINKAGAWENQRNYIWKLRK